MRTRWTTPIAALLAGAAFLVPLTVAVYGVWSYANDNIAFAQQEALGNDYVDTGIAQVVRERLDRLLHQLLERVHRYSLAMGRGSRPITRWKNDRQRKKKERAKKHAAPAAAAPKKS